MKKFIAMVMTAAMVASLVPATAFAKGEEAATARIVDAVDYTKDEAKAYGGEIFEGNNGPELRVTMTEVANQLTPEGDFPDFTLELTLDNAEWDPTVTDLTSLVSMWDDSADTEVTPSASDYAPGTVTPGTPAYEEVYKVDDVDDLTLADVQRWAKNSDGVGAANTAIDKTWDQLEELIDKTSEEKIAAYEDLGWTLETDPNGDQYLTKANREPVKVFDGATGAYETAFEADSTGVADLLDAVQTVVSSGDPIYALNETVGRDTVADTASTDAYFVEIVDQDVDYVKYKIRYNPEKVKADDYFIVDLDTYFTKLAVGTKATVDVEGVVDADGLVYASIEARGITATTKKVGVVAEEEKNTLKKDLVITSNVGDFVEGQVIELKLSKGFEFVEKDLVDGVNYAWIDVDGNYAEIVIDNGDAVEDGALTDEIIIRAEDCTIEATSAKAGATCTMTVKAVKASAINGTFSDSTTVEVMTVVDYTVIMSVDEDKDVPVIYSGVNVDNYGITDDSDHLSLEVTLEETFPGAWSFRKGFNLELPEGVYVTDVNLIEQDGFLLTTTTADDGAVDVEDEEMMAAFFNAYQEGDHVNFEFEKRVFDDVDAELNDTEAKVVFELELVADPGFVGDVTLKLTGELVDEQEVVIANFATPYTVTAEQNDLKIDYRYTEIPTEIVITETEAGLWAKDEAAFGFYMDKEDYIVFEDDPVYTVTGGLELEDDELVDLDKDADGDDDVEAIYAAVDTESDEPATITISDMSLFMQRSIPAGPYDLKGWTSMAVRYEAQQLFAPDCMDAYVEDAECECGDSDNDCFVGEVCDYSSTVKEAFVNVVTAGREQDDASFTTVVSVPVGELYIVAGEDTYEIDVPAYINANGYTMLPVRAVAVALGINTQNVLWDQATKTVTILYGQRIITMQVGASVIYVNGSAIPASSSVEIVDGRTFLGLRDLATALGVTTIDWDPATKTALLNAEFED